MKTVSTVTLDNLITNLNVVKQKCGNVEIELHALMTNGELYYAFAFLDENNENDEIYKILGSPNITHF